MPPKYTQSDSLETALNHLYSDLKVVLAPILGTYTREDGSKIPAITKDLINPKWVTSGLECKIFPLGETIYTRYMGHRILAKKDVLITLVNHVQGNIHDPDGIPRRLSEAPQVLLHYLSNNWGNFQMDYSPPQLFQQMNHMSKATNMVQLEQLTISLELIYGNHLK